MPVVEAVVTSANCLADRALAKRIEAAMVEAVWQCKAEKIEDPAKVKERIMEARQRVLDGR